jgi:hypothetical protein
MTTITLLAQANPKTAGSRSHARFALYQTGMTVGAYREACVALGQPHAKRNATADIAWDLKRGFIALVTEPPVTEPPAKPLTKKQLRALEAAALLS